MSEQGVFALAVLFLVGAYLVTINLALVPARKRPGLIWIAILTGISVLFVALVPHATLNQAVSFTVWHLIIFFVFRGFRSAFLAFRDKRRAGRSLIKIMGDVTMTTLGTTLMIAVFLFGLFQFAAGWTGIEQRFGWGWGIAAVIAGLCGFSIPLTIGTFLCARNIWHWSVPFAVLFTLPGLAFMIPQLTFGIISSLWGRIRPAARLGI